MGSGCSRGSFGEKGEHIGGQLPRWLLWFEVTGVSESGEVQCSCSRIGRWVSGSGVVIPSDPSIFEELLQIDAMPIWVWFNMLTLVCRL